MKVQEQRADYFVIPKTDSAVFKAARLGDVTDSMKNGLYKPASEYGDDGVPCLRMYNIDAGKIVWRDIKRMRVSASELEDYGLVEGDFLVNRVNSRELVGKTALIPPGMGPSVFESKNIRLRLKTDQALPKFINYQLLAFGRQHFSNNAQQVVGMASVSQKQLADFPIVLTSLAQQKRIVAEIEKQFSRLDEAVANLKRVKANLKRYKAAVLKAAVEGRLVETEAERARREGRSYETGTQLLQRILETRRSQWQGKGKYKEPAAPDTTDLPELPEGWVWATVDQTAQIISGLTKNPKRDSLPSKLPYLRVANVYANKLRLDQIEHIGVADSELQKLLLQRNDLLVVEGNGSPDQIGRVALWDGSIPNCVHQNHIIKVRFSDSSLPKWAMNWLLSPSGRHQIEQVSSSTSGLHTLSTGKVSRLPVPIPPLAEQHRIVAEVDRRLSLLRATEAQVNANLQRAERLRQSILSRAFTGGLSSHEPHSELMDEI